MAALRDRSLTLLQLFKPSLAAKNFRRQRAATVRERNEPSPRCIALNQSRDCKVRGRYRSTHEPVVVFEELFPAREDFDGW